MRSAERTKGQGRSYVASTFGGGAGAPMRGSTRKRSSPLGCVTGGGTLAGVPQAASTIVAAIRRKVGIRFTSPSRQPQGGGECLCLCRSRDVEPLHVSLRA